MCRIASEMLVHTRHVYRGLPLRKDWSCATSCDFGSACFRVSGAESSTTITITTLFFLLLCNSSRVQECLMNSEPSCQPATERGCKLQIDCEQLQGVQG